MNILMIGGNFRAMVEDVRAGLTSGIIDKAHMSTGHFTLKDGSSIRVISVQNSHDMERLRGLRPDFVIEHPSFPRDERLYSLLRVYTRR